MTGSSPELSAAGAILGSWQFDFALPAAALAVLALYCNGWRKLHRERPHEYTRDHLILFTCGVASVLFALMSPIEAFSALLLQAHMVQHLLLILAAPGLIWLGKPEIPLLRGLPGSLLKDALGPFLRWRGLRNAAGVITHPIVCWMAMSFALVFWHLPRFYELGLSSPAWHKFEHACFFLGAVLFWRPVAGGHSEDRNWPGWLNIPYLVFADMVNTALSAWLVFSKTIVYPTYAQAPRLWGISALDDQVMAGAIMWIPGSLAYLIPAFLLTMRAINPAPKLRKEAILMQGIPPSEQARRLIVRKRRTGEEREGGGGFDLLRLPLLGAAIRNPRFRKSCQAALFLLAALIVIDGFCFPAPVGALSFASILPWTYWRGFAVIALLAAGNLFCMACPFMLAREAGRKWMPGRWNWPRRLRSKWLAAALLGVYFCAAEAFGIWDRPWWTAWIVVGYFIAAAVVDGLFRGASFCKYICPIGQFHFVNALASPFQILPRSREVCDACRTHDCIKGNAGHRGCELNLFVPTKTGNLDCTFCLDCVHACTKDNVSLAASVPGSAIWRQPRHSVFERRDVATLIMVVVAGSLVNAAAMSDPVMMSLHSLHARLGLRSVIPLIACFYAMGLAAIPMALAWFCASASRLLGKLALPPWRLARAFAPALIPAGFSLWAAHFGWHLVTGWRSVVPVLSRFVPAFSLFDGSALDPAWLPNLQLLVLDGGAILSIYAIWRTACRYGKNGRAVVAAIPWAILAFAFYGAAVWVLSQPMQMLGAM